VHHLRHPVGPAGDPGRRARGRRHRRRDLVEVLSGGHAAAAAAGHPGGDPDQRHQRLQLLSHHLGDDPRRPGLRDIHHDHLHGRPQGGRRRPVGGHVSHQLPARDRHRRSLPVHHPLEGAGRPMITTTKPAPKLSGTVRPAPRARFPLRTWLVAGGAYLVALIFLLPYLEMLIMAMRPNDELEAPTIFPKHFTFSNFATLWSGGGLGGSIGTSLQIAAGATVIVLLVALPAAYCTARRRFRGRTPFLLLVLATQMFQPAA